MKDLVKSPLVREQKSFEQRLAAAVLCHATEDFMLFEESSAPTSASVKRDRKRARLAQESADRFFDRGTSGQSDRLEFWMDVLAMGKPRPAIGRHWYRRLLQEKRERYEAAVLKRTSGQIALAGIPATAVVEAYRRIVDERWIAFYAREAMTWTPVNRMTTNEREFWRAKFRASLTATDLRKEAEDVLFEIRHGLLQVAA